MRSDIVTTSSITTLRRSGETRGVGGIFFDDLDTAEWQAITAASTPLQPPMPATAPAAATGIPPGGILTDDPYRIFPFVGACGCGASAGSTALCGRLTLAL